MADSKALTYPREVECVNCGRPTLVAGPLPHPGAKPICGICHARPSFFREWCTWCGGKTCQTGVWNGMASPCDSTCCSRHTHMDAVS